MELGHSLESLALHPSEAAILINKVEVPTEEVYELYSYTIGEYKDKVICWPISLLKEHPYIIESKDLFCWTLSSRISPNEAQNFCTPLMLFACDSLQEFLHSAGQ